MTADEKVKDYLKRALIVANTDEKFRTCVTYTHIIETAKMIQLEEHRQGKKEKRTRKDKDCHFDYDTKEWNISDDFVEILKGLYSKDLKVEFTKMTGWLLSHPKKHDFKKFVNNWLSKDVK